MDLRDATASLIAFEAALEDGTAAGDAERRRVVAGYNQDDCRATGASRGAAAGRRATGVLPAGPGAAGYWQDVQRRRPGPRARRRGRVGQRADQDHMYLRPGADSLSYDQLGG